MLNHNHIITSEYQLSSWNKLAPLRAGGEAKNGHGGVAQDLPHLARAHEPIKAELAIKGLSDGIRARADAIARGLQRGLHGIEGEAAPLPVLGAEEGAVKGLLGGARVNAPAGAEARQPSQLEAHPSAAHALTRTRTRSIHSGIWDSIGLQKNKS